MKECATYTANALERATARAVRAERKLAEMGASADGTDDAYDADADDADAANTDDVDNANDANADDANADDANADDAANTDDADAANANDADATNADDTNATARAERAENALAEMEARMADAAAALEAATARTKRVENRLAPMKACVDSAAAALETAAARIERAEHAEKQANDRAQKQVDAHRSSCDLNFKLLHVLTQKGNTSVAALLALQTTSRKLSEVRIELATERHAASERA
ncbi:hypothetical protein H4R19_004348 [Coemansia spiralis]|nr:hypothetical protein H4R19_004348 [Coemansia spiralis]